jgi:hypothetical protein
VIIPSCAALFAQAEGPRRAGRNVIDPGAFEAGKRLWRQCHYYQWWDDVITAHVFDVLFVEGWEFSAGCVLEYGCALRCGRPVATIDGNELRRPDALARIDKALAELPDKDAQIVQLRDDIACNRAAIETA